jgi:hypothetical protein
MTPQNDTTVAPLSERAAATYGASLAVQGMKWLEEKGAKAVGDDVQMSPDDVKQSFGMDVKQPMSYYDAEFMSQRQQAKDREAVAFKNGSLPGNLAANLADPTNAALLFIPVAGEANLARLAGQAGLEVGGSIAARAGVRAGVGFGTFAGVQAPISAANYALDKQTAIDHSIADSLREVLFAGLLGSVAHPLFGAIGDAWKGEVPAWARAKYSERADAAQTGLSQMMNERPIDVPDFKEPLARPDSIKDIVNSGGNPLFHDTSAEGVKGILEKGEITPNQTTGQEKPTVSVSRDFDNYSRYKDSPYRLVLNEAEAGSKSEPFNLDQRPGERGEAEQVFKQSVSLRAVKSLAINISNPAIAEDVKNGILSDIVSKAEAKGLKVEYYKNSTKDFLHPDAVEAARTTIQEFARSQENLAREGTSFGSSQEELRETKVAAEEAPKGKPLEPTKELADLQQKADDAETQLKAAYGVTEGAVKEPGLLGKAVQKVKETVTGKLEENLPPELQQHLKEANEHKEYIDTLAKSYESLRNCLMG